MPPLVQAALVASGGYLLGCLSPGHLLVRLRTGTDVRGVGSGGTGARNVGRVLGRTGFAAVFLADAAKGAAAVWLAAALGAGRPGATLAALAVVLGHVFPAPLGFRGGKGASTAFGALLALDPLPPLAGLALCALLAAGTRQPVAAGLAAFALLPGIALALGRPWPEAAGAAAVSALVLLGHRDNLAQLAAAR